MCPSSSPNPGQHLSALLAKGFAGNPTEPDNSKPHDRHFSLWGHNGSHCVAMPEGDQNCQQEDEGGTTTSSDDDAKTKTSHSFDFFHLPTSIDQLKKSLQDEEADSGHEEEKSRLPSSACTATSMCIAKIKESLRQEQEKSNDDDVSEPRRSALPKSFSKPMYARTHSENRPWRSAAACGGTTPATTATTKKSDTTCSLQWQQLHHDEGTYRPTSLIDQWEMNNKNNLQANSSAKDITNKSSPRGGRTAPPSSTTAHQRSEPTKSKLKRVGASMA